MPERNAAMAGCPCPSRHDQGLQLLAAARSADGGLGIVGNCRQLMTGSQILAPRDPQTFANDGLRASDALATGSPVEQPVLN